MAASYESSEGDQGPTSATRSKRRSAKSGPQRPLSGAFLKPPAMRAVVDYGRDQDRIGRVVRDGQTEAEALELVEGTLRRNVETEGGQWERLAGLLDPRMKFLVLLQTVSDEAHWSDMLRMLPALVDQDLAARADLMQREHLSTGQLEAAERMQRLSARIREHLERPAE